MKSPHRPEEAEAFGLQTLVRRAVSFHPTIAPRTAKTRVDAPIIVTTMSSALESSSEDGNASGPKMATIRKANDANITIATMHTKILVRLLIKSHASEMDRPEIFAPTAMKCNV